MRIWTLLSLPHLLHMTKSRWKPLQKTIGENENLNSTSVDDAVEDQWNVNAMNLRLICFGAGWADGGDEGEGLPEGAHRANQRDGR